MFSTTCLISIMVSHTVITSASFVNFKNKKQKLDHVGKLKVHAQRMDSQTQSVSNLNSTKETILSGLNNSTEDSYFNENCEIQFKGYYDFKFNFCSSILQIQCFQTEDTEINGSGDTEDDIEADDTYYRTSIVIDGNNESLSQKFNENNDYFESYNFKHMNQTGIIYLTNTSSPCNFKYDININVKQMYTKMDMIDGKLTTSSNKNGVYLEIKEVEDQEWLSIVSPVLEHTASSCILQVTLKDVMEYQVFIRYNKTTTKIYSDSVQSDIPIGFMSDPFSLITRLLIGNDGDVFVREIRLVNCTEERTNMTHPLLDLESQLPDSKFVCSFEESAGCPWLVPAFDKTYCSFYMISGLDSIVEEIPVGENGMIGKFVDHSLKSYTGHFLYITGRQIRSECHRKGQANISTLWFRKKEINDFNNSCNLSMNIKGNIGINIVFRSENGTGLERKIRDKTIYWHEVSFPIPDLLSRFFIEILTEVRPSEWNFIAIDDIYFTKDCFDVVEYVTDKSIADTDDTDVQSILTVTVGSSLSVFIVIAIVIIVRCQKHIRHSRTHQTFLPNTEGWGTDPFSPLVPQGVTKAGYFQNLLTKKNPNYEWYSGRILNFTINEIQRERLKFSESNKIGSGAFGEVFSGILDDKSFEGRDIAIKKRSEDEILENTQSEYLTKRYGINAHETIIAHRILQNASEKTRLDFFLEALTLSKFSHDNIVECIGISVDKSSMMLVLELLPGGDLKTFLRQKHSDIDELSFTEKIDVCYDVVKGCQYLENVKFIHRDIAARNCLLTSKGKDRIVKVADFGLARDIMISEYYRKTGSALLPVRWMPPESFLDGYCSSKSDVWSYGVLVWEVFSYAQIPYNSLSNTDVIKSVCGGGRLEKPDICSEKVYDVMQACWKEDLKDRPSFFELSKKIKALYEISRPETQHKQKVYTKRKRHNTYMEDDLETSPLA